MKLDVLLAVPEKYQAGLDLDAVRKCFPYGKVNIQIQVRLPRAAIVNLSWTFVSYIVVLPVINSCRMEV